ncbi:MAG: endoflagellar filament sheath protein [Leptospirales bacterium]|nr:endoflagellar filament sheath protein [Leptospirales bacterium]
MDVRKSGFLAIFASLMITGQVWAQAQPTTTQPAQPATQPGQPAQPATPAAETVGATGGLEVILLDDFEESEDWHARSTCPLGETTTLKMVQRGEIRAADDEQSKPPEGESLNVQNNPDNPNHILGIKTYFDNRGFDRVEVKPPHEYVIKGKARQFSVWVLGRKFRHNMSLKLRDYRGNTHNLPLGRLDFFGWRKLTVTVPGWLPQSTRYALLDKNLHFVSLFVTSDVHEVPGQFYFYVDGLKALVDKSENAYPGSEVKDNW